MVIKRWFSPPIQLLFWLLGLLCLAGSVWSLWGIFTISEETQSVGNVSVEIPDMSALNAPSIMSYRYIVESPLFWSSRTPPQKRIIQPVAQAVPAPVVIDTSLPDGRLVGIIDLGNKSYAIMSAAQTSYYLYEGDKWGNWTVDGIDPDRVILTLANERQEIPLIGDFSSPQENPKLASERKMAEKKRIEASRKIASVADEVKENVVNDAFPEAVEEAPPILSIKDALEARKRLMESRWGSIRGGGKGS